MNWFAWFRRNERLCKYFDIPYQHASRPILERMKRGGNREIYERQSGKHSQADAGRGTCGPRSSSDFPEKARTTFNEVLTFSKNVGFDNVGVFLYSDEEGTGAFDLDSKVPRTAAVRRRNH